MSRVSLALDTRDLAEHYERASVDRQFKAGQLLIERVGICAGDHVLDVGAGTGLLAEHVAGLVGADGHVYAIDPLPLRIEIARRKQRANLTFSVDDAYSLKGFADASFDVIYLNAVFHWFEDKRAPLRNFSRLLKAGGKLGISTGSKEQPNRIHDIQRAVLAREPYSAYSQPEQGLPQRVSPDELSALLSEVGFTLSSLSVEQHVTYHADAEAALQHSQASSFGNLLGHLPAALQDSAKREISKELEALRTPQGLAQAGGRIIAVASKR
jgi:arsenite methyltransferase